MDYQKILKISEEKLKKTYPEIIEEIKNRISSGSTGGEIIATVGKYLKDLELINIDAYSILKADIDDYLYLCKKNGLNIR